MASNMSYTTVGLFKCYYSLMQTTWVRTAVFYKNTSLSKRELMFALATRPLFTVRWLNYSCLVSYS